MTLKCQLSRYYLSLNSFYSALVTIKLRFTTYTNTKLTVIPDQNPEKTAVNTMKLIKPSEISAKILTMLQESNERVILVSPYMRISKWYKLLHKINRLKTRRILTEIYVRDDPDNQATYRDLDQLALQYIKIHHLHSKLYMNEKYGIVTSLNLLLSSEINSLEIGYSTETPLEYKELFHYYQRYIRNSVTVHNDTVAGQPAAELKEMMHSIREKLKKTGKNSWLWFAENALHISTGRNNYRVMINDGYLRITACLRTAPGAKQQSILGSSLVIPWTRRRYLKERISRSGPSPSGSI